MTGSNPLSHACVSWLRLLRLERGISPPLWKNPGATPVRTMFSNESEALAIRRPLVVLNPVSGQEAANSDFLLERGAAIKVNRLEDIPFRLEQLLAGKKLSQMAKAAATLGRPKAAQEICAAILERSGQPARAKKESEIAVSIR